MTAGPGAPDRSVLSRRALLTAGLRAGLALPLLALARPAQAGAAELAGGVVVQPRAAWADGLEPTGPLAVEAPGDVRLLVVHHTAGAHPASPADVPGVLRDIFRFHTGERGWPDVAYNFFVDPHGGVWEGRQGSLAAPVKGDATGGSQGFGLLACWLGNHSEEPPTPAAVTAMTELLAALALTYRLDPHGQATFVSRGSNLHPAGSRVTVPTIVGHRGVSQTACPGDAAQALVTGHLPDAVAAHMRRMWGERAADRRAALAQAGPPGRPPAGAGPPPPATLAPQAGPDTAPAAGHAPAGALQPGVVFPTPQGHLPSPASVREGPAWLQAARTSMDGIVGAARVGEGLAGAGLLGGGLAGAGLLGALVTGVLRLRRRVRPLPGPAAPPLHATPPPR